MATIDNIFQSLLGAGVTPALPTDRNKRVLVQYYNQLPRTYKGGSTNDVTPEVHHIAELINKTEILPSKDGSIEIGGVKPWNYLNPTSGYSTYSDRRIDTQRHIETFNEFARRAKNLSNRSNRYFGFDIETLGDSQTKEGFMVSEISITGHTMKEGEYVESKRMKLDKLIRPDQAAYKDLNRMIQSFRNNPQNFKDLSPTMKRTLIDLMRYSDIEGKGIVGATFGKHVIHSTVVNQVLEGKTIIEDQLLSNVDFYTKHMRKGLENLKEHGEDHASVIEEYNTFLKHHERSFFVTMNGDKFDVPVMSRWGDKVGVPVVDPKYHMDYQKVEEAIVRDPIMLHQLYGRPSSLPFEEGSMTLNEHRTTLGLSEGLNNAHLANADSGFQGVGGVVSKTWRHVDEILRESQVDSPRSLKKRIGQRSPYLSYSTKPLTMKDQLFATRAVMNYSGHELDMQMTVDTEGNYKVYRPGFNKAVVNAETQYRPIGVRDLSSDGVTRYGLELANMDDENLRSFIIREGNHAGHEITDFLHRHMEVSTNYSKKLLKKISKLNLQDKTRRRYEGIFELSDGKTKGFQAAERLYGAASVLQQRLDGKWKNIKEEADQRVLEIMNQRSMKGVAITPEQLQEIHEGVTKKLLAKRVSHEHMEEEINKHFHSLWDDVDKKFVFNADEAKQFWEMSPRLLSELPLYSQAITSINKNVTKDEDKRIAWSMFHEHVRDSVGDHKESRRPLPYERSFRFFDKHSEKYISVNTSTPDSIAGKLSSYVYRDTKELDGTEKSALIQERYKTILASLNDSRVITNDHMEELLDDFYNRNLSITDSIRRLSVDLSNQSRLMIEDVHSTSIARRLEVEQLTKEVRNRLVKTSIDHSKGVQGFLIKNAERINPDLYVGNINQFFEKLDKKHAITGMIPKNRQAVEQIISHYMSHNPSMHYTLSIDEGASNVIFHMFHKEDAESVLRHLTKGTNEIHPKSFEMAIPLVSQAGTMTHGSKHLNAVRDVIRRGGTNEMISSVQKMSMMLTDKETMTADQRWEAEQIQRELRDGNFIEANKRAKRSVGKIMDTLSGRKREFGKSDDTLEVRNNEADLSKQDRRYLSSAMIQDWYENGSLKKDDFRNKDVIINETTRQLHPFVSIHDLSPDAQQRLRMGAVDWAQANGMGKVFYSNVKGDSVIDLAVSNIDARDLTPYGHMTNQGRDNPVQLQNTYGMDGEMEARINGSDVYTNFNDMTTTRMKQQYNKRLSTKRDVHVKAAYLSQEQVDDRIQAMAKTEEGRALLQEEGIMDEHGDISKVRYPNVYEQQAIMSGDLLDRFQMQDYKIERGEDFRWHRNLMDPKTKQLKAGHALQPGDIIGYRTKDGMREEVRWERKGKGTIISGMNDPEVVIRHPEDAIKFHLDIEKLTPGGGNNKGQRGFSAELLEALTGVEGTGIIYNPDIRKHEDFGALLRSQANKIHDYVSTLSPEQQQQAFDMINKSGIGVRSVRNPDGSFHFLDTSANMDKIQAGNFYSLFDDLSKTFGKDISEQQTFKIGTDEFKTTWGIQALRGSSVVNYATMVDENRRAILSYDIDDETKKMTNIVYGSEVKGVKYGPRELSVLRRMGAQHTYDYVYNFIKQDGQETGRLKETMGMLKAIGGAAYSPEAMDVNHEKNTLNIHDFERLPVEDSNIISNRHTILDPDYINSKVGTGSHGFWLNLPKVQVEGRDQAVPYSFHDKPIDKVFIPSTKLEGRGNELWKRDLQRHISNIYKRAAAVDHEKDPMKKYEAHGKLQTAVSDYLTHLTKDVTSSGEQTGGMLKTHLPTSSSALTKVMPISRAMELDGETVFIHPDEAKALGVYDHIMGDNESALHDHTKQKAFYVTDLRYPTFTDKAIQVAKLKIDPHANKGEHMVSSLAAAFLNADSDGDYNNIVAIKYEKVQAELAKIHNQEQQSRTVRHEAAYQKALSNSDLYQAEIKNEDGMLKSDADRSFTLSSLADSDGDFHKMAPNQPAEVLAKSGKQLVGQASDINFRMRQWAEQYVSDPEGRKAIENFGEGLEQKLTISAKHFKDGQISQELLSKNGAVDLLNSVRTGNWKLAKQLDEKHFSNMFTNDHDLEKASYHMGQIQSHLRQRMIDDQSTRQGTSSGISLNDEKKNFEQVANIIFGKDPSAVSVNEHASLMQRLMTEEGMIEGREADSPKLADRLNADPYETTPNAPKQKRLEGPAGLFSEAFEDMSGRMLPQKAYDKTKDVLNNFFNGKNGKRNKVMTALGGLAMAGAIGYNTLNDNPIVAPNNIPSQPNDPYLAPAQSAPVSSPPSPAIRPIEEGNSSAHINVQAKGQGHNTQTISQAVSEGMRQSNYSGGKINMTVNHSDNTSKLNRIWYRDKVDQHT
jgi:hypothetical protein